MLSEQKQRPDQNKEQRLPLELFSDVNTGDHNGQHLVTQRDEPAEFRLEVVHEQTGVDGGPHSCVESFNAVVLLTVRAVRHVAHKPERDLA